MFGLYMKTWKLLPSTVFDTGVHGLGGRLGTRLIDDSFLFDTEIVNVWLDKGLVREWNGNVGELKNGGEFLSFLPFFKKPEKD